MSVRETDRHTYVFKIFQVFILLRKILLYAFQIICEYQHVSVWYPLLIVRRKYQFLAWKVLQGNLPIFLRVIQVFFLYSYVKFGAN